ncbi:MAG: hypothetical protein Q4B60_09590, partial [Erysipelotrichaceae bacterium]|nr:hypothetical protein [Erysipelotrichaceae bacterium]
TLDEENGKLIITMTNGDRTEAIEVDVNVTSSAPKKYVCNRTHYCGLDVNNYSNTMTVNSDGTWSGVLSGGGSISGTISGNSCYTDGAKMSETINYFEDGSGFTLSYYGICSNGGNVVTTCKLVQE